MPHSSVGRCSEIVAGVASAGHLARVVNCDALQGTVCVEAEGVRHACHVGHSRNLSGIIDVLQLTLGRFGTGEGTKLTCRVQAVDEVCITAGNVAPAGLHCPDNLRN